MPVHLFNEDASFFSRPSESFAFLNCYYNDPNLRLQNEETPLAITNVGGGVMRLYRYTIKEPIGFGNVTRGSALYSPANRDGTAGRYPRRHKWFFFLSLRKYPALKSHLRCWNSSVPSAALLGILAPVPRSLLTSCFQICLATALGSLQGGQRMERKGCGWDSTRNSGVDSWKYSQRYFSEVEWYAMNWC